MYESTLIKLMNEAYEENIVEYTVTNHQHRKPEIGLSHGSLNKKWRIE